MQLASFINNNSRLDANMKKCSIRRPPKQVTTGWFSTVNMLEVSAQIRCEPTWSKKHQITSLKRLVFWSVQYSEEWIILGMHQWYYHNPRPLANCILLWHLGQLLCNSSRHCTFGFNVTDNHFSVCIHRHVNVLSCCPTCNSNYVSSI